MAPLRSRATSTQSSRVAAPGSTGSSKCTLSVWSPTDHPSTWKSGTSESSSAPAEAAEIGLACTAGSSTFIAILLTSRMHGPAREAMGAPGMAMSSTAPTPKRPRMPLRARLSMTASAWSCRRSFSCVAAFSVMRVASRASRSATLVLSSALVARVASKSFWICSTSASASWRRRDSASRRRSAAARSRALSAKSPCPDAATVALGTAAASAMASASRSSRVCRCSACTVCVAAAKRTAPAFTSSLSAFADVCSFLTCSRAVSLLARASVPARSADSLMRSAAASAAAAASFALASPSSARRTRSSRSAISPACVVSMLATLSRRRLIIGVPTGVVKVEPAGEGGSDPSIASALPAARSILTCLRASISSERASASAAAAARASARAA
mmetsp:Transcript_7669/g.25385  ORF Transcript_7669/g.25385 Transcript_7669/m.25385 type:complete len:388 (+) Transcript_7669:1841-3004(+)